jgi:hypothetical protein
MLHHTCTHVTTRMVQHNGGQDTGRWPVGQSPCSNNRRGPGPNGAGILGKCLGGKMPTVKHFCFGTGVRRITSGTLEGTQSQSERHTPLEQVHIVPR